MYVLYLFVISDHVTSSSPRWRIHKHIHCLADLSQGCVQYIHIYTCLNVVRIKVVVRMWYIVVKSVLNMDMWLIYHWATVHYSLCAVITAFSRHHDVVNHLLPFLLLPTKEEVNACACLSVSKITQKCVHEFGWNVACRQKCCMSTDVGTWTNWLTFEPDPDYSPDAGTGLLSPLSYKPCYAEFLRRGKIRRIRIGRCS